MANSSDMTEALLKQIQASNQKMEDNSIAVSDLMQEKADASTQQEQAYRDANSTVEEVRTRENALLKAQTANNLAASALGTNMQDSSEIITSLSARLRQATLQAANDKDELYEKLSTNFFDNPASYIVNQFTLGDSINKADASTSRAQGLEQSISNMQKLTQENIQTQNSLAAVKSVATVAEATKAAQAKADAAALTIKMQTIGINIDGINRLDKMSIEQIAMANTGVGLRVQQEQLALRRTEVLANAEAARVNLERNKLALKNEQMDAAGQAQMIQTVQAGFRALNPSLQVPDLPPSQIVSLLKSKDPMFDQLYKTGMTSLMSNYPVLGATSGEAAGLVHNTNATLSPAMSTVRDVLKDGFREATTPSPLNPVNLKDPNSINAVATKVINTKLSAMATEIKPNDAHNVYAAPPMQSLLAEATKRGDTNVAKLVAVTGGLKDIEKFDPIQIASLANAAVKAGTMTSVEAQNATLHLANLAVISNNVNKQFPSVGMPLQDSYKVIDKSGFFSHKYDMNSAKDVSTYFMRNSGINPDLGHAFTDIGHAIMTGEMRNRDGSVMNGSN